MSERSDAYDAMPGLRRSDLWEIRKSPEKFISNLNSPKEQTPALKFGSYVHMGILEPRKVEKVYKVAPNVDRRTKTGKAAWDEFLAKIEPGQEAVTQDEYLQMRLMAQAVTRNDTAMKILTAQGYREKVYTWTDTDTDELLKMKADIVIPDWNGHPLIVDYKTTSSCADNDFERSCRKYGYDFQAGFYTEGYFANEYEDPAFAFIAQEKEAPYSVRVYFCDAYFIEQGKQKFRDLLGIYHACKSKNSWPGYPDTELLGE